MVLSAIPETALVSKAQETVGSLDEEVFALAGDEPSGNSQVISQPNTTTPARPLPHLPLEVLERILTYTFIRWSRLTPSSDPLNLNNTTHLLLVSKAFRELCLPLFYRSVTITRPSHYTTFFNPQDGIFVGGEDGKKRWSYVRELSIIRGIEPPLIKLSDSDDGRSKGFIAPLAHPLWDESKTALWPETSAFIRICLLDFDSHHPVSPCSSSELDQLYLSTLRSHPSRHQKAEQDLQRDFALHDVSWEEWVRRADFTQVQTQIMNQVEVDYPSTLLAQERFSYLVEFLDATEPQVLIASTRFLESQDSYLFTDCDFYPVVLVHLHSNFISDHHQSEEEAGRALARTAHKFATHHVLRAIRVMGLEDEEDGEENEIVEPFVVEMERMWKEEEETEVGMVEEDKSWEWACHWENGRDEWATLREEVDGEEKEEQI